MNEAIPVVISIAGSDSGGGAGIQADLKAFARCGVHGTTAITAITAQNTLAVNSVHPVPPEAIRAQVAAVAEDIGIEAVKIGMLGTVETTDAVVAALEENGLVGTVPVVLDPVMVAESGATLLEGDARSALIELLLPRASVVTPNLPEAAELTGLSGADRDELAAAVLALGTQAVIVTGGHTDDGIDLLLTAAGERHAIAGPRYPDGAAHGSGCTHSSALAACLALGASLPEAARSARDLTGEAVAAGLRGIGAGAGPVDVLGIAGGATRRPISPAASEPLP
ncbi:MAG: bifunctional hydroxymethylpyrimidine kinase/phosphomethylpyrimidine kinase [Solirubrobacterales bacterium]